MSLYLLGCDDGIIFSMLRSNIDLDSCYYIVKEIYTSAHDITICDRVTPVQAVLNMVDNNRHIHNLTV